MRVDLRMLALAGFIPERGYKKAETAQGVIYRIPKSAK